MTPAGIEPATFRFVANTLTTVSPRSSKGFYHFLQIKFAFFFFFFQKSSANTVRSPSPQTERLVITANNSSKHMEYDHTAPVPKRASESIDIFCKLKERRLQEFYREQMTKKLLRTDGKETQNTEEEAASDLSTKSSQSPIRSPHTNSARSSPSDYHKVTSPPTMSLQQKLKILSESSSPKLSACDEMLTCKEIVRKDCNTTIQRHCDSDGKSIETKKEQATSGLMDDTKSHLTQLTVAAVSEHEHNPEGREYVKDDCDMQILNADKRTTFTKNDSNNNNRDNGECRRLISHVRIVKTRYLNSIRNTSILFEQPVSKICYPLSYTNGF